MFGWLIAGVAGSALLFRRSSVIIDNSNYSPTAKEIEDERERREHQRKKEELRSELRQARFEQNRRLDDLARKVVVDDGSFKVYIGEFPVWMDKAEILINPRSEEYEIYTRYKAMMTEV